MFVLHHSSTLLHAPQNRVSMDELASTLAELAKPIVRAALIAETSDEAAAMCLEEADHALRALLRDPEALGGTSADPELLGALREAIRRPEPPDQDEIATHAREVGRVLATSWLQLMTFMVESPGSATVDESLLPSPDETPQDLWRAWELSLDALPIRPEDAPAILRAFAQQNTATADSLGLPGGLTLEVAREQHNDRLLTIG